MAVAVGLLDLIRPDLERLARSILHGREVIPMGKTAALRKPEPKNDKSKDGKTPRERFEALAPKRTKAVLAALRVLGNCAGVGYEYTEEEGKKIVEAIEQRVEEVKGKFLAPQSHDKADRDSFSF